MGLYHITSMNEYYIGKISEIQEIEEQLGKARKPYIQNLAGKNFKTSDKLYKDKEVIKLQNMIKNQFNFDSFYLEIINMNNVNAMTIPVSAYMNYDPNNAVITSTKEGYRFKNRSKTICIMQIYSRLFCSDNYTDGELMAIILHEIGHNFQEAMNGNLRTFKLAIDAFRICSIFSGNIMDIFYISSNIGIVKNKINSMMRDSMYSKIIGYMKYFSGNLSSVIIELDKVVNIATLGISSVAGFINNIVSMVQPQNIGNTAVSFVSKPAAKGREKVSDDFAMIYGYGPELSSALGKMEADTGSKLQDNFNKLPVLPYIQELFNIPIYCLIAAVDVHPKTPERVNYIIDNAKKELENSELSPDAKKELSLQIKEMEDVKNDFFVKSNQIPESRFFYKFMLKRCASKVVKDNKFSDQEEIDYLFKKYQDKSINDKIKKYTI